MNFQVSALSANEAFLERLLEDRPKAQIIHVISHDYRRGFHQIFEDGIPFLDEFGCPVFVSKDVDWFGHMTDIDERYAGTGLTSADL